MRKLILLPMLFICMMFSAFAYTVVDYEPFNYSGGTTTLYNYGWRNDSLGSLDLCTATGSYMLCYGAGTNKVLSHIFNQEPEGYCLTENGSYGDFALNFSIRFNIALVRPSKTSSDIVWYGVSKYQTPALTGRLTDIMTRIYANYSGYSTKPEDFLWETNGGITHPIVRDNVLGDWHTIQMDFFVTNASSPANAKNIYAGNITVINSTGISYYYAGVTNPALTNFYCLNSTYIRFNTDFLLDDLYVIAYNSSEYFIPINQSITIGTTYECSDGIDNDVDGFIDMDDPSCESPIDDSEAPFDATECNDGEDNDGDNLIDYPADPYCSDFSDNSEAPKNIFQCNDEKDNDGDGYTDYPDDPSCLSYSGTTESPKQSSILTDDICSVSESCIIKTTFPYSDSVYFHGWANLNGDGLSDIAFLPNLATRGLLIDNYGLSLEADLERNFTNPMSYDYFNGEISFQLSYTPIASADEHIIYFALQDDSDTNMILLEFDINTSVAYSMPTNLYLINSTGGKEYITSYNLNSFSYFASIEYSIDNLNNTITIAGGNFPFSNSTTPSKVRIYVNPLKYDGRKLKFYFTNIQLFGKISAESICTAYTPPYYLKEDFNFGYLSDCGWAIKPDLLVNGKLQVENSLDYLYAVKSMYDTKALTYVKLNNRFTTITFSYNPKSTSSSDSGMGFFVYDYGTSNIVASFNFDKDGNIYSFPDGNPELLATITPDLTTQIKIIFDVVDDSFKFYINNGLVKSGVDLQSTDYNYEDIYSVYLTSSYTEYEFDSLYVFTSDAIGTPLLSLGANIKTVQNESYLFGIIYKATPNCVQDSDCPSNKCSGYGKCTSLNYKMCDEYGYNRTNWCFFKLFIAKSLEWIVNMILDNFLLFLGLLILLLFVLFFWGHIRRGA